jgi:hypothetical protein
MTPIRSCAHASMLLVLIRTVAGAQGMSPLNDAEKTRFERVTHAVEKAGYKAPMIVGHGQGTTGSLFVLLATRGDSGVLVVTADPGPMAVAKPIVLERDRDPAQLGVRGVRFDSFLGATGLFDVEVQHEPFQLESSRRFSTHHIVRGGKAGLVNACEFGGDMSSSASKGIGSITSTRRVTIAKAKDARPLTFDVMIFTFDVKFIDETIERRNRETVPTVTAHNESRTRYELPESGSCREIR